jgi:hypothetical protein
MSETNGNNGNGHNGKRGNPKKDTGLSPQALTLETCKDRFIANLKTNGGIVSRALKAANLSSSAAYEHFHKDKEFADAWLAALEYANDELFIEAKRRAVTGELRYSIHNGKRKAYREKSDTLLIFLMKQGDNHKKWRQRIIQTGNIALESVRDAGSTAGLTEDQITAIQSYMHERFQKVSLM